MRKILAALAAWLSLASFADAQTCAALPFTFSPNTTIHASQVNSDFASLLGCANTQLAPLVSPAFTGTPTGLASGSVGDLATIASGGALGDSGSTAAALFTTGDVKMTIKTTADAGWVMMNDGTIGDATSGGTTRANADTSALFALLWTNCANAQCPVSSGRGGSAAADFAAHKTINLPLALGRAMASAGSGSGLTSRLLGATAGAETASIAQANLPNVNFSVTDLGHRHTLASSTGSTLAQIDSGGETGIAGFANAFTSYTTGGNVVLMQTSTTGISVASGGSGTGLGIMQPSTFINVEIKL